VYKLHSDLGFLEFDEAVGVGGIWVLLGPTEPDAAPIAIPNLLHELQLV
jgi:hypothetical protein